MAKLLLTDAIIRARKLGLIARANAAGTRLWIYKGYEDRKSEWVAIGNIEIEAKCLVDNASFDLVTR